MPSLDIEHAETQHPTPSTTNSGDRQRHRRRHRRRPSMAGCSSETTTDGSFRFSDTSEDEYHSWGEVDLESAELEMRNDDKEEESVKDCRICHLSLMGNEGINAGEHLAHSEFCDDQNSNDGICIELGCACKGDLGNAHKQCAETWFKIKGDTTCEICGAIAINVAGEQVPNQSTATAAAPPAAVAFSESNNYCHGKRIINFLLTCMIFAFVISWLFHFNITS